MVANFSQRNSLKIKVKDEGGYLAVSLHLLKVFFLDEFPLADIAGVNLLYGSLAISLSTSDNVSCLAVRAVWDSLFGKRKVVPSHFLSKSQKELYRMDVLAIHLTTNEIGTGAGEFSFSADEVSPITALAWDFKGCLVNLLGGVSL